MSAKTRVCAQCWRKTTYEGSRRAVKRFICSLLFETKSQMTLLRLQCLGTVRVHSQVAIQLIASVPQGSENSAGLDSSHIAGLENHFANVTVHCYCALEAAGQQRVLTLRSSSCHWLSCLSFYRYNGVRWLQLKNTCARYFFAMLGHRLRSRMLTQGQGSFSNASCT